MEFVDEHKDEADGAKQLTTSDASQSSSRHGLLSIKTLQPWHIPEYNVVGFTFQIFFTDMYVCVFGHTRMPSDRMCGARPVFQSL